MAGFRGYRSLGDAALAGQMHTAHFRKVPSQASAAGQWVDLSMASGNPKPNYYASSPLAAATLPAFEGIFHGDAKSPATKHLSEISLCSPSAGFVGTFVLLDYLLYYPFVDFDDTDVQTMDNTVTLPRYTDGEGVRAMLVAVAPTVGGGAFTYDYVDHDGAAQTSPVITCNSTADAIATVPTSQQAGAVTRGPLLLPMASTSRGIRSITSFTNTTPNGGLCAIVLVKEIARATIREINVADERSYIREIPGAPRIVDGAYLNLVVNCTSTVAAATLAGRASFIWN